MKKFLKILLAALFFVSPLTLAQTQAEVQNTEKGKIKFIYLHGSNCNTTKDIEKFKKQATKLHGYINKYFNKNEVVTQMLMEEGTLEIDPEPKMFIWGDRSATEINMLKDLLDVSKLFSPKLAQLTRSIFAHCMHDAIWVQEYYNMAPILKDLHKEILEAQNNGERVVLLGYSAGTFITLRYILGYSPVLDSKEFLIKHSSNLTKSDIAKMEKINPDKTCLNAILSMNSVFLNESNADVKIHLEEKTFLNEYSKLNEKTKLACYDDKNFKGIINFGSPIFLFSSSLTNLQTELGQYSEAVLANYVSKGHFWLSLNFKEDPLGFSDDTEYYVSIFEKFLQKELESDTGFIYDDSKMAANRLFITAHYAYLTRSKLFAKNMAKAFEKAYKVFYKETVDKSIEIATNEK